MNIINLVEDDDGNLTEYVDILFEKPVPESLSEEIISFFGIYQGSAIHKEEGKIIGLQVIPEAFVDYLNKYSTDQTLIDEFHQAVEKAKQEYEMTNS